jgi:mannose-6-phosphate isomerase-like protein (cupin superfamily)
VLGDAHSQAVQMMLDPGETEGGPDNRHRGADQWLFVINGEGSAVVGGKWVELRESTLVLIQRGETHEIRDTGQEPLRTLNVYVPTAYTDEVNEPPTRGSASALTIWPVDVANSHYRQGLGSAIREDSRSQVDQAMG